MTHDGRHYRVHDVTLLPRPRQRPRVPIWIGGFWPHRPPMRRAARWDGAVPLFLSAGHGYPPPVDEVRDLVAYVRGRRDDPALPFEVVLGGAIPTDAAGARDLLGPLIEAGATWWDERRPFDDEVDRLEPVLRRIERRPPCPGPWLAGGGRLAGALLGEIDELVIKRYPVVLGAGIPVSSDDQPHLLSFELVDDRTLRGGTTVTAYTRRP